jgi:hypothetical protein
MGIFPSSKNRVPRNQKGTSIKEIIVIVFLITGLVALSVPAFFYLKELRGPIPEPKWPLSSPALGTLF